MNKNYSTPSVNANEVINKQNSNEMKEQSKVVTTQNAVESVNAASMVASVEPLNNKNEMETQTKTQTLVKVEMNEEDKEMTRKYVDKMLFEEAEKVYLRMTDGGKHNIDFRRVPLWLRPTMREYISVRRGELEQELLKYGIKPLL